MPSRTCTVKSANLAMMKIIVPFNLFLTPKKVFSPFCLCVWVFFKRFFKRLDILCNIVSVPFHIDTYNRVN